MCSGDAQQLFDGRIMPCRNRSLKCSLATCSSCGGNRRGLQWTGCPVVSIAKRAAVVVPHSRFLKQIIDFPTSYHSWKWTLNRDNEFEQAKNSVKNRRRGLTFMMLNGSRTRIRMDDIPMNND
ncbi:hypothetical protein T03_7381 [Trichinella britovi]|uniref:Uncharacterized protein n=1 Tax=Trichinella britovi TaxID=45882 RepID=A0A0V1CDE5_TRIBR|nr:hypothetical protein T03_7381 [Trichinella britovi]